MRIGSGYHTKRQLQKIEQEKDVLQTRQGCGQIDRDHGRQSRQAHQGQLQEGIVLANGGRMHLSGRQRKIPVPREGLGRR